MICESLHLSSTIDAAREFIAETNGMVHVDDVLYPLFIQALYPDRTPEIESFIELLYQVWLDPSPEHIVFLPEFMQDRFVRLPDFTEVVAHVYPDDHYERIAFLAFMSQVREASLSSALIASFAKEIKTKQRRMLLDQGVRIVGIEEAVEHPGPHMAVLTYQQKIPIYQGETRNVLIEEQKNIVLSAKLDPHGGQEPIARPSSHLLDDMPLPAVLPITSIKLLFNDPELFYERYILNVRQPYQPTHHISAKALKEFLLLDKPIQAKTAFDQYQIDTMKQGWDAFKAILPKDVIWNKQVIYDMPDTKQTLHGIVDLVWDGGLYQITKKAPPARSALLNGLEPELPLLAGAFQDVTHIGYIQIKGHGEDAITITRYNEPSVLASENIKKLDHILSHNHSGPKQNPHDLVVGIDLGTTNSLLTYFDGNAFKFMEWQEGRVLLPSVATYDRQGLHYVGYEALAHPLDSGILTSTKRLLDDPSQHIWGKVTPLKVATDILGYMKHYVEQTLGRTITACIITVPAYFDEVQRLATKTAASLAGLNVLRLIHEPTAAALAYGLAEDDKCEIVAVYDFGGGTFDVSILSITDQFHVLATHGDTMLGGDDIDTAILQHWCTEGRSDLTELKKQVTSIKEALSAHLAEHDGVILTRVELSSIIAPLLAKTFDHFDQALKDAGIATLDGIVLVGGATKTYGLKDAVQERYPFPIYDHQNPETIVALGAGMHAHSLIFGGQHVLLDVTPLSLGVEMAGGLALKIIHRNTPLPVRQEQIFTTYEAGQQGITFNIVQGERERAQDCRSLARFTIGNLPPMPAGKARAHVTFQIDVDGLITVSAIEHITGQTLSIQIESTLSKEECDAFIADAMVHAKEDLEILGS